MEEGLLMRVGKRFAKGISNWTVKAKVEIPLRDQGRMLDNESR